MTNKTLSCACDDAFLGSNPNTRGLGKSHRVWVAPHAAHCAVYRRGHRPVPALVRLPIPQTNEKRKSHETPCAPIQRCQRSATDYVIHSLRVPKCPSRLGRRTSGTVRLPTGRGPGMAHARAPRRAGDAVTGRIHTTV